MTTLIINEKRYTLDLKGNETLLEVLRDTLGLTGTKTSCQESECGACTVNMDGRAILSCITLAIEVGGKSITTIEGLSNGEELHPIQKAYLEHGGTQCGFCTPGFIMASHALLNKNKTPNEEEIAHALDGNICRCTGYLKIFKAVREAGKEMLDLNKSKS